jgi:hypothetical protein
MLSICVVGIALRVNPPPAEEAIPNVAAVRKERESQRRQRLLGSPTKN